MQIQNKCLPLHHNHSHKNNLTLKIMKTLSYNAAIQMLQANKNAYLHAYCPVLKFVRLENQDGNLYRVTEKTFEKLEDNGVIKQKREYTKVDKYTYSTVTNVLA